MNKITKLFFFCLIVAIFISMNGGCSNQNEKNAASKNHIKKKESINLGNLEKKVNELVDGDEIILRRNINKVYELANIYAKNKKINKAIYLYEKALSVDSSNITKQWELSILYDSKGEKEKAINREKIVFQYAEDINLIKKSKNYLILNNSYHKKLKITNENIDSNIEIIILPVGELNPIILKS